MARRPQADEHGHVATSKAPGGARARLDEKLDDALKATFPASDPFALTVDEDPNSRATYASPPCFMHELDPSYLGLRPQQDTGRAKPADPPEDNPPDAARAKAPDTA